jgi:hypothetical protein
MMIMIVSNRTGFYLVGISVKGSKFTAHYYASALGNLLQIGVSARSGRLIEY